MNKILTRIYLGCKTPKQEDIDHNTFLIAREIETYTFPFEVAPEPFTAISFTGYSITESKYSEDEELLTIEIGINTDYSLEKVDSDLLQVSEELPGQFCPKKTEIALGLLL